jgi:hypothetical protein
MIGPLLECDRAAQQANVDKPALSVLLPLHDRNAAVYALRSFDKETLRPDKPTSGRARGRARAKTGDEKRPSKNGEKAGSAS